MNVFLCLMLVCVCGHLASGSWTKKHRDLILNIHNEYRRGVKDACDMTDLVYDKKIEESARHWAQQCIFAHEMGNYGENIAYYTKYGQESELITKMAKMWYDEVKDYTYGMNGCGAACHYTQMIWANTKKVGCYAADCPRLRNGGNNAYYLVCFYSPPGNYGSQQPYQKNCDKNDNKNKGGSNEGSSNNNNNNKNNNNNNNNNNVDLGSWESQFNNNGGNGWQPWPEETGNNNGWTVVKKTGSNGNGGQWVTWTASRSYK